jgi:type II secretory pathway component PulC
LRKGDVIRRFNGTEINSPEAASAIYDKLRAAPASVAVEIERDGKLQTLHWAIH